MDEALTLQGEDHLVNGGWGDLEVGLEVTFSRWSAVDLCVGVDECQILPLQGSEGW
jgi:hypothetical protein